MSRWPSQPWPALLALAAAALIARPAAAADDAPLARDLHEQLAKITVSVSDLHGRRETKEIPVTIFRPDGSGPFPLVIMNHGRATAAKRAAQKRQRFEGFSRYMVAKGFVVMLPTRVGYADTYGDFDPEAIGRLSRCAARRAGDCGLRSGAGDARPSRRRCRMSMPRAGSSPASRSAVSRRSRPRGGIPRGWSVRSISPGAPAVIPTSRPVGPAIPSAWPTCGAATPASRRVCRRCGSIGRTTSSGGPTTRSSGSGPGSPAQAGGVSSARAGRQDRSWRDELRHGSLGAVCRGLSCQARVPQERCDRATARFELRRHRRCREGADPAARTRHALPRVLAKPKPRAFAIGADGAAGYAFGDWAMGRALGFCQQRRGAPCKLYAVDDDVVWAR